ncbi:hypothetical protein TNCT_161391 [Trichonephila clavata]|uniref:Uncharacterized protein n=1 Tax=Trichonephila clavata TaxID=2740835 RepID=A0A8X6GIT9_TRICU|nr:hypothetical protein TNCT_161391 [Trichonephila clavata]
MLTRMGVRVDSRPPALCLRSVTVTPATPLLRCASNVASDANQRLAVTNAYDYNVNAGAAPHAQRVARSERREGPCDMQNGTAVTAPRIIQRAEAARRCASAALLQGARKEPEYEPECNK